MQQGPGLGQPMASFPVGRAVHLSVDGSQLAINRFTVSCLSVVWRRLDLIINGLDAFRVSSSMQAGDVLVTASIFGGFCVKVGIVLIEIR